MGTTAHVIDVQDGIFTCILTGRQTHLVTRKKIKNREILEGEKILLFEHDSFNYTERSISKLVGTVDIERQHDDFAVISLLDLYPKAKGGPA